MSVLMKIFVFNNMNGIKMKKIKFISLGLFLSLTGCSGGGEPSESEISDALANLLRSQIEASSDIFEEDDVNINSIRKVGCVELKETSGYNCDIEVDIDVDMPFVGKQKQQGIQTLRFIKTDQGWSAVGD